MNMKAEREAEKGRDEQKLLQKYIPQEKGEGKRKWKKKTKPESLNCLVELRFTLPVSVWQALTHVQGDLVKELEWWRVSIKHGSVD